MQLGIFARTFPRPTLGAALDAVAATGIRSIQFNLSLTGGPSLPREIPGALAAEVRAAVAARGLTMAAVSGTYNMAHPSAAVREDGRRRLAALIAAAPALGTRVVTLCTGTRDPDDLWRAHPGNAAPDAWRDSVESLAAALEVAERSGVVLGIEPEHANVAVDARAARRLLDELRSPHLRVVIDAANLIVPGALDRQDETLHEAFDLLGDDIVLAHAKDVTTDGSVVAAGLGGLDYGRYARLLRAAGYDGPLILHGLAEDRVAASARYVAGSLSSPAMADYGDPRSYLSATNGADVVSADGQRVGTLTHVLADAQDDIFDGIVIDPSAGGGHRFVDAPEVDEFYERAVTLKIAAAQVATLPAPSANPAVMENHGVEDAESKLHGKLRRAWDLISGRTY